MARSVCVAENVIDLIRLDPVFGSISIRQVLNMHKISPPVFYVFPSVAGLSFAFINTFK